MNVDSMLFNIDGEFWWEVVGEKVQKGGDDFTERLLEAFVGLAMFERGRIVEVGTGIVNRLLTAFKSGLRITEKKFEVIFRRDVEAFDVKEALG